ncbi:hypothetical protein [Thermoproteus tenax]|uniref:Uncharacterized protein n=1 Tax=Thermoproteus tenax (strain ATCC 35583 / DSM 2078 / JCM 9277 / NBRC 100435 / Kra 1) TaxID=768679 RepID=G4RLW0_THETK|nr:hypothetical protein [Thermoproteus tenax]CCC82555.1 hypothetical protein TTX_1941 [Thermoproteus tenax Kra 1]
MIVAVVALTIVAVLLGLAMRRVRDRALAALGVIGFFMIALPALFASGDIVGRIISIIFAYGPYWEYVIPLLAFALALLPPQKQGRGRARRALRAGHEDYW